MFLPFFRLLLVFRVVRIPCCRPLSWHSQVRPCSPVDIDYHVCAIPVAILPSTIVVSFCVVFVVIICQYRRSKSYRTIPKRRSYEASALVGIVVGPLAAAVLVAVSAEIVTDTAGGAGASAFLTVANILAAGGGDGGTASVDSAVLAADVVIVVSAHDGVWRFLSRG